MKLLGTISLETDRLILRKFKLDDAEGMFNNWCSDLECNKFVSYDIHQNVLETKEVIKKLIDEYDAECYNWIIEVKSSGEVIGNISAFNIRKKHLSCEVGYSLGSKFWNKGYATEALKKVIDFLLNNCDFYLIEAYHRVGIPASGKVMEKSGMKKEALLRTRELNKVTNQLEDLVCYSITKDDLK